MEVECSHCGVQFEKIPSQIKKSKSGLHYCGKSCAAKANNKLFPKRRMSNRCITCDKPVRSGVLRCSRCKPIAKTPKEKIVRVPVDCLECGCEISINQNRQRKFCSTRCKSKFHQQNLPAYQKARGIERKKYFVDLAGGKCTQCGYCKNLSALSFHHLDPSQKSFSLDSRNLSNRSIKTAKIEFDKCVLLCMNCHTALHNPDHEVRPDGFEPSTLTL